MDNFFVLFSLSLQPKISLCPFGQYDKNLQNMDCSRGHDMSRRLLGLLLTATLWVAVASAQMSQPFKMTVTSRLVSDRQLELVFSSSIEAGWHMYSTHVVENGPNPTVLKVEKITGASLDGPLTPSGNVIKEYDAMFDAELYYFEHSARFVQKVKLDGGPYAIEGYIQYSGCNDQSCTPPISTDFQFKGTAAEQPVTSAAQESVTREAPPEMSDEAADSLQTDSLQADSSAVTISDTIPASYAQYWEPVTDQLRQLEQGGANDVSNSSLWRIFLLGLLGGFVALATPCVWPIIPMTVSFFLHRSSDKRKGVRDAVIYGISIIVIYLTLGLLVTGIFGASALNSLATNAVFNIFFFLLLVVFAASFLGAFELRLPSKWSNAVDAKSEKSSGVVSIFLMAFTLALVSFSCTGPIIGFLLVEVSTSGSFLSPAIGMLGFAIALALPFTLFALFPCWLKQMPKSGGWMNVVKVVLGFIELAFALKFLSVADLAYGWGILDRETFLALWIALFLLLGLYLLGLIKFQHDDDDRKIGVTRFFLAIASIAFSIYMVPGLWGAPLKAVSAFAPPMSTQDFNLYDSEVKPKFSDYDAGMQYAREYRMPVMIDFTGYGCVNCRKMEAAVWTDETVKKLINDDYVLIQLFVDDKTALNEPIVVEENGQEVKLRTVGDRWSYLQRSKFGANAQPFYVLLDNNGRPLTASYAFDDEPQHFIRFLRNGLDSYK